MREASNIQYNDKISSIAEKKLQNILNFKRNILLHFMASVYAKYDQTVVQEKMIWLLTDIYDQQSLLSGNL
jgi:hypothetical protein